MTSGLSSRLFNTLATPLRRLDREGPLALHDVAGRVRGGPGPRDGLDDGTNRPGLVDEYVNLGVFSPTIGRQLLALGLIDEIDLHIAPVLLGDGIRLYDNPGGEPLRLDRVGEADPRSIVNLRYRPATADVVGGFPPQ